MKPTSISDAFENIASAQGAKKAITFFRNGQTETVLSYSQLSRDIVGFADILKGLKIQKGDRVILLLEKSLIAITAHLALQKLGVVTVPLNPGFKKSEIEYLLGDADAKLVILDPEKKELIRDIVPGIRLFEVSAQLPYQALDFLKTTPAAPIKAAAKPDGPGSDDIDPNSPALIIYTSGTTGKPKGAILTQRNLVHDAQNIISIWEMSMRDVLCHTLPLFHVHGLCFALHTVLLSGGHLLMLDTFTPDIVLDLLSRKAGDDTCTMFMAVPVIYTKMIDFLDDGPDDKPLDFGHIRLMTSGSAPLLEKEFKRIDATFGIEPVEREGMSETGMNFSNPLTGKRKPGSIGISLPSLDVRIVDPKTGTNVDTGDVGELWLKSPAITPGYFRKPAETKGTFENGWFKTGDMGKVDDEGYYYLTDRIKHIIITGGENVSAKEVEMVINQIEEVVESSVVGILDEKWGEKVVAAVVVTPGSALTDAQIITFCKKKLHDWKCPKKIIFLDEIPRNTMGKMLKETVKNLFAP